MAVVNLRGGAAGNFMADLIVDQYGAEGARERTCGEMRQAVDAEIARRKSATLKAFDDLSHADRREQAEQRAALEREARQRL
jgi:hypothetical protein